MEQKEEFTGEKLKALRKKHGLTQQQLASELNIYQTKISEWETGRYAKISKAYQTLLKLFFEKLEKNG